MARKSLEGYNCSLARTLDIIGDQWSLLILREAFLGVETFSGFYKGVGVARNILSDRLERMVANDILTKSPTTTKRYRYILTKRGKELLPALVAMMQWGDKWIFGTKGEPVRVLDRKTRSPIQKMGIVSRGGQFLEPNDLLFEPGPGAKSED